MMNERHDVFEDLETELSALTPVAPSDRLKQRISVDLNNKKSRSSNRRIWQTLSEAAAACVVVAVVVWQFSDRSVPQPEITKTQSVRPPVFSLEAVDSRPASLAAYRKVMFESPEALEMMLDRDADVVLPPSEPINLAQLD